MAQLPEKQTEHRITGNEPRFRGEPGYQPRRVVRATRLVQKPQK